MPPQYNQMVILFILIYVFDSIVTEIYNGIKVAAVLAAAAIRFVEKPLVRRNCAVCPGENTIIESTLGAYAA